MGQPWGPKVQEASQQILLDGDRDVFIFKFKDGSGYVALPRLDVLQMQVLMSGAEIVYFCSQRMKHITGAHV